MSLLASLLAPLLATDPGAGNIAAWTCVILVVGGVVLWLVTMLMLRGTGTDAAGMGGNGPGSPPPSGG